MQAVASGAQRSLQPRNVGGPVLTREQAPLNDSEASTVQTVAKMAEHIRNSAGDPAVKWCAHQAAKSCGPGAPASALARAVFYFLKSRVRFRTDDDLIALMRIGQDELELLVSPPVLLRHPKPEGDCDDFTMACCALLHELGVQADIVTVKADQPDPGRWSHVYCSAQTEQGPMILDTSHGDFPGWEVPYFYQKRTWDSRTGQRIADEGARTPQPRRRDSRLHGYTRTGMGAVRRRRGLFGLGQVDCDLDPANAECTGGGGGVVTDPMTGVTYTLGAGTTASGYTASFPQGTLTNPPVGSTPSIWGAAFASNLSNIISKGFQTLQLAINPTGGVLVQGPNGQYTIANNSSVPLSSLNLGAGMNMGTILLAGGAILGVVLIAGALGKK
jgi:hypothetical protein